MSRLDWQQIEELFHQAADLSPAARERFLASLDPTVAVKVRGLLAADQPEDLALQEVIHGTAASWASSSTSFDLQPDRVGPYRILRPLGTGGMGAVFLAERDDAQFDKLVAIKVLRAGFTRPDAAERFRRERQILAQLDHPYTARLLDGGTMPDGRPFLVMEYVDGESITDYANRLNLSPHQRCELLLKVAEAVTHAHQGLIVHRDIKPGNILVDHRGNPRLLDFGIAKLITTDLDQAVSQLFLTPQYASPEQLRGDSITTAADVYGLGAVLYELLANVPPHTSALERLADTELAPPSRRATTTQRIPFDLDNIVLKAMAPEPARRYRSAEAFADDLRRFLSGDPVLARGNSVLYRAGKFARRAWLPLVATLAVVATLTWSTVHSRQQAAEANRLRFAAEQALAKSQTMEQLANNRLARLRLLSSRLLFDLHDSIAPLPGSTAARKVVIQTALEQFDPMAADAPNDARLSSELATAYQRIGDVQGNPTNHNLGDATGALKSYAKATALRLPLLESSPADAVAHLRTLAATAEVLRQTGQTKQSDQTAAQGLLWAKSHPHLGPQGLLAQVALLRTRARNAVVSWTPTSFPIIDEAFQILNTLPANIQATEEARAERLMLLTNYARILMAALKRGNYNDRPHPTILIAEAFELAQQFRRAHPNDQTHTLRLIQVLAAQTAIFRDSTPARLPEALSAANHCVELTEQLWKADSVSAYARVALAGAYLRLAGVQAELKNYPPALAAYRQVIHHASESFAAHPDAAETLTILTLAHSRGGEILIDTNQLPAARTAFLSVIEFSNQLVSISPSDQTAAIERHYAHVKLGHIEFKLNHFPAAVHHLQIALKSLRELAMPSDKTWRSDTAGVLHDLALSHAALARKQSSPSPWAQIKDLATESLAYRTTPDPTLTALLTEASRHLNLAH